VQELELDYDAKTASVINNQVTVKDNSNQVRVIVGLHIYPFKLFKQDDSFLGIKSGRWLHRFFAYTGVGIPDPLKNYYFGVGADLIPGFKLTVGEHLFRNYKYNINNNQIVEQHSALKIAGAFIGFSIEPSTFVKAIGIIK
jgi:hypothetical protein